MPPFMCNSISYWFLAEDSFLKIVLNQKKSFPLSIIILKMQHILFSFWPAIMHPSKWLIIFRSTCPGTLFWHNIYQHLVTHIPENTLWETMTFFSNHVMEQSLWDRFYAGRIISLFQKIRFIIGHNARRDCQVHVSPQQPQCLPNSAQCSVSRCWVHEWNKLMVHN